MKKYSFWDILAWIALASIIIWVTLKISGVINTPLWLEYAPVYSATYVAGWMIHQLKDNSGRLNNFERFKEETINEIHKLKLNCAVNHKKE
jgi:hypothetical protein